jgi:hypothetical protein
VTGFGEIEVVERTTRYRPRSQEAFHALAEHLGHTAPAAPAAAPDAPPEAPAAADDAKPPKDPEHPHVRLYGSQMRVNAGELAPSHRIWDVCSKDLAGGIWRSTPWIVDKVTKGLVVRPRNPYPPHDDMPVRRHDGYYLVRRSIQSRIDDVCVRLAGKSLQMWVRPCKSGTDSEYRVMPTDRPVPKILAWRES